nr:hypothetical protein [Tanacetum cinerariifolium]GFA34652.1 hypothetical protein [Tanacetum cinerariifolium]
MREGGDFGFRSVRVQWPGGTKGVHV